MELLLLGFGLTGKTCPISLIIDKALEGKKYSDFDTEIEIRFLDERQANLVERVYNERVKNFQFTE